MKWVYYCLCTLLLIGCGKALQTTSSSPVPSDIPTHTLFSSTTVSTSTTVLDGPSARLPTDALASFDPNTAPTLEVGGRQYTKEYCNGNYCYVTLWPDNARVWVMRETIGETKISPTPITVFIPFTPTPAPPCKTANGITRCGWGDLDEELKQAFVEQYGGNIGQGDIHPTAMP